MTKSERPLCGRQLQRLTQFYKGTSFLHYCFTANIITKKAESDQIFSIKQEMTISELPALNKRVQMASEEMKGAGGDKPAWMRRQTVCWSQQQLQTEHRKHTSVVCIRGGARTRQHTQEHLAHTPPGQGLSPPKGKNGHRQLSRQPPGMDSSLRKWWAPTAGHSRDVNRET